MHLLCHNLRLLFNVVKLSLLVKQHLNFFVIILLSVSKPCGVMWISHSISYAYSQLVVVHSGELLHLPQHHDCDNQLHLEGTGSRNRKERVYDHPCHHFLQQNSTHGLLKQISLSCLQNITTTCSQGGRRDLMRK